MVIFVSNEVNYKMVVQEELEHERGLGIQQSQEAQDRISEELELAISSWKRSMNAEVAKAKEFAEGILGNENLRQLSGFSTPLDLESYISKVNYLPFLLGRKEWSNP